jgi:hypothetical protein
MTAPDESGNTGVAEVPETHRLDEASLTRWMEAHVESFRGPVYRKPRFGCSGDEGRQGSDLK